MDEAKQLLLGMMQTIKERIGNPFLGAFVVSWSVWNFKILIAIFGTGKWQEKIQYIYTDLMKDWTDWAVHGYLIPSVAAIAWIFVLPPFFRLIAVWHETQLNENRKAIFGATEQRVLTPEDATILRTQILEEKTKIIEDREALSKVVEKHVAEKAQLISDLKNHGTEIISNGNQIRNLQEMLNDKREEFNSLQLATQDRFFNLSFDGLDLNKEEENSYLAEIGFSIHPKIMSPNKHKSVIRDEALSYWPLAPKGSIQMGELQLLNKSTIIDESCACVIFNIYNETKINKQLIIYKSDLGKFAQTSRIPNYLSSVDYLISINHISHSSIHNFITIEDRLLLLAECLIGLGFKYREIPYEASDAQSKDV